MKKISLLLLGFITLIGNSFAQLNWQKGGNNIAGSAIPTIGTAGWNMHLITITNGINRTKLNQTLTYPLNGLPSIARDGYFLIGQNSNLSGGTNLYAVNRGAFSLLHLNGNNPSTFAQEFGYRNWMQTGITFTENDDRGYMGYKRIAGEANDFVFNWSDNAAGGAGPDNMVFNFTTGTGIPPIGNTADLTGTDDDGREIMRLTALNGFIGIGPRFNNANQPTSTLHQHQENAASSWFQITNQFLGGGAAVNAGPTAIAATDGLRLGIFGSGIGLQNGIAMVYNQENRPLLFSTNANTTTANAVFTQERFRLASVGTPTQLPGGLFFGTYNPAAIVNTNLTRASLSHNPVVPIVRPMSLFHLGYNANVNTAGTITDGWRPWMDIGTYTSSQFDNMYVGLKEEGNSPLGPSTYDAVINWGRNQDSLPNQGPDHLRFIFTSNYAGGSGDANQADDINGLEMARFYAGRDTTGLDSGAIVKYGRFGIGDFTVNGLNQEPTHKLDVDGNGRFRLLPDSLYLADTTVQKIVMVDSAGVLRWKNVPLIGQYCADTVSNNGLTDDYVIKLNDFNYHFDDDSSLANRNNVGIGTNCTTPLLGRLQVQNPVMWYGVLVNTNTDAVVNNYGVYANAQNAISESRGVYGQAIHSGPGNNFGVHGFADSALNSNYGGYFEARGVDADNFGVYARALNGDANNFGVNAIADANGGTANATGGLFNGTGSTVRNIGVQGEAIFTTTTGNNFGGAFRARNGLNNYAVYAQTFPPTGTGTGSSTTPPPGPNFAGYFLGDVFISGVYGPSDENMKENIDSIANADSILALLKPVYFNFKQTGQWSYLNLPQNKQAGLLAQDVEALLPSFVKKNVCPDQYDSTGTIVVQPSFNFKTVDYDKFIPLLIAGYQSQQEKIDSLTEENNKQDSINNALNDRLTALENCINSLNLCSPSAMAPTGDDDTKATANITLQDVQSIVLSQNVPNPFAEQTTIAYALNDGVKRAQMLFYNAEGKLINSIDLSPVSGKGQLNVFADDLSNGVYTYTLIVDGNIIDTKRMVKSK